MLKDPVQVGELQGAAQWPWQIVISTFFSLFLLFIPLKLNKRTLLNSRHKMQEDLCEFKVLSQKEEKVINLF